MKRALVLFIVFLNVCQFCKCYNFTDPTDPIDFDDQTEKDEPKAPWNETEVDTLRKHLLSNYKYQPAARDYNATTTSIYISVKYLQTHELNSTISVSLALSLRWLDMNLTWKMDDYGGVVKVLMGDHEIWKPDIHLCNSALGGVSVLPISQLLRVSYHGSVGLYEPTMLNALCEYNLYYWPFDTQHCYLNFASKTYSGRQIEFNIEGYTKLQKPYELSQREIISPWDVRVFGNILERHNCCPDIFNIAQFELVLTRKWLSYVPVVIVPLLVVMILTLIQCCSPCNSSERIILSCCTILMIIVLLEYFLQKVPAMGGIPWIIIFYSTCLFMVSISMAISIYVSLILKVKKEQPLPWVLKQHFQGKLGKLLLLRNCFPEFYANCKYHTQEEIMDNLLSDAITKTTPKTLIRHEWELFAIATDRMLLLIHIFIFSVLFFCYMI